MSEPTIAELLRLLAKGSQKPMYGSLPYELARHLADCYEALILAADVLPYGHPHASALSCGPRCTARPAAEAALAAAEELRSPLAGER